MERKNDLKLISLVLAEIFSTTTGDAEMWY